VINNDATAATRYASSSQKKERKRKTEIIVATEYLGGWYSTAGVRGSDPIHRRGPTSTFPFVSFFYIYIYIYINEPSSNGLCPGIQSSFHHKSNGSSRCLLRN
jgi:hypothetical protein